jgi:hypothetical protein
VPLSVVACVLWGRQLHQLALDAPPFVGHWDLRVGLGTPIAALLGLLVVGQGPRLAQQLSWRVLPWVTTVGAAAWSVSLALVDGTRGIRQPLTSRDEYLHDLPRVHDVTGFLSHFVEDINTYGGPHPWTTHVAGHPPGMLLLLAGLREIGLGGPWPAAVLCIAAGSSAAAAVLVTARRIAGEDAARAAAPFLVVLPAAVWIAVSADAVFLGVSAWGIALLAGTGLRRAAAGGAVMGASLLLTYGLLTLGVLALTVLLVRRRLLPLLVAAAATGAVVGGVALLGFRWWDGLSETLIRYSAGAGGYRPYSYFVVADLAVFAVAVGPAAVAGLVGLGRRDRLAWLVAAAGLGLLLADASGKAKGEVERIWLPFGPWIVLAAARLDRPRVWLALQAVTGLTVQTVLLSKW